MHPPHCRTIELANAWFCGSARSAWRQSYGVKPRSEGIFARARSPHHESISAQRGIGKRFARALRLGAVALMGILRSSVVRFVSTSTRKAADRCRLLSMRDRSETGEFRERYHGNGFWEGPYLCCLNSTDEIDSVHETVEQTRCANAALG
jgi:hypothetical protein